MEFVLHLPRFEGPLDLLLYLIERNKYSIEELELCPVVDQYMDYINTIKRLNIELAAEFLDMASYLIWIKSSSLLAINTDRYEGQEEGPIYELKEMLLAYQGMKRAARMLNERPLLYRERFPRGSLSKTESSISKMDISSILKAIYSIRERTRKFVITVAVDRYPVRKFIAKIRLMLRKRNRLSLEEIAKTGDKTEVISIFLAALELSKASMIRLVQKTLFGDIYLIRRTTKKRAEIKGQDALV